MVERLASTPSLTETAIEMAVIMHVPKSIKNWNTIHNAVRLGTRLDELFDHAIWPIAQDGQSTWTTSGFNSLFIESYDALFPA